MKQTNQCKKLSLNEKDINFSGEVSCPKSSESGKRTRTPDQSFWHNKKVGSYLLGERLGEGSFAKVKLALHIPTGQKVAVKIINKQKIKNDNYMQKNLHREGKILQMLRHPNILQILDVLESANNYYLVTEYCPGGNLIEVTSKKVSLPEELVWKYVRQIVDAVAHLHQLKVVHRDLKTENLLLDAEGNIKIIDFGLSNILPSFSPDGSCLLQTQCGSPAYAAPELLAKQSYGPKVDVWSIGVITFSLLVGKLPFTVKPFNISTLFKKMLRGEMNSFPESVSPLCRSFIRMLLNPNHKQRPYIDEVLRHKWLSLQNFPLGNSSLKTSFSSPEFRQSGEKTFFRLHGSNQPFYCHSPVNLRVVKEMKELFGFEESDVFYSIRNNKPGSILCTYYLLLKSQYSLLKADNLTQKGIEESKNNLKQNNLDKDTNRMQGIENNSIRKSNDENEKISCPSCKELFLDQQPINRSLKKVALFELGTQKNGLSQIERKYLSPKTEKTNFGFEIERSGLAIRSNSSQFASEEISNPIDKTSETKLNTDDCEQTKCTESLFLNRRQSLKPFKTNPAKEKSHNRKNSTKNMTALKKLPSETSDNLVIQNPTSDNFKPERSILTNTSKLSNQRTAGIYNSNKQINNVSNTIFRKSLPSRVNKSVTTGANIESSKSTAVRKRGTIVTTTPMRYNKALPEVKVTKGNVKEKIIAFEKRKNLSVAPSILPAISCDAKRIPGEQNTSTKFWATRCFVESHDIYKNLSGSADQQEDKQLNGKLLSRKWQKLYSEKPKKTLITF